MLLSWRIAVLQAAIGISCPAERRKFIEDAYTICSCDGVVCPPELPELSPGIPDDVAVCCRTPEGGSVPFLVIGPGMSVQEEDGTRGMIGAKFATRWGDDNWMAIADGLEVSLDPTKADPAAHPDANAAAWDAEMKDASDYPVERVAAAVETFKKAKAYVERQAAELGVPPVLVAGSRGATWVAKVIVEGLWNDPVLLLSPTLKPTEYVLAYTARGVLKTDAAVRREDAEPLSGVRFLLLSGAEGRDHVAWRPGGENALEGLARKYPGLADHDSYADETHSMRSVKTDMTRLGHQLKKAARLRSTAPAEIKEQLQRAVSMPRARPQGLGSLFGNADFQKEMLAKNRGKNRPSIVRANPCGGGDC